MRYIIDANNLAGKLGLLDDKNFDCELIGQMLHYFGNKKHQVDLVFDGIDYFGDKSRVNNLNIIRAPRGDHGHSADDKIVEMVECCSVAEMRQLVVVTDDTGLLERIKEIENEKGVEVEKMRARNFSQRVENKFQKDSLGVEIDDGKIMKAKDVERINDELLKLWS